MNIKNIYGELLFSDDFITVSETLKNAVRAKAYLQGAYLQGANLQRAYLQGADLQRANLQGANLQGADLQRANLQGAYLQGAYLQGAYLQGADLQEANLQGANLQGANLQGADLQGANLQGADLPHFSIVPEKGCFTAFKKTSKGVIEILVPEDAKRVSSIVGRKCRASHIIVISGDGSGGKSPTYGDLVYNIGDTIYADSFNDDIRIECANGIHFFMTYKEAEGYDG